MPKIAAHRIHLPDGTILPLSVVELDAQGRVVAHHPLVGEEAHVTFYSGDYIVPHVQGVTDESLASTQQTDASASPTTSLHNIEEPLNTHQT